MHREPVSETGGRKSLSPVLRGAAHLLSAHVFRVLIQTLYYILVARALGADDTGKVMALLAVFTALVPFIGLGYPFLAVRGVARDPESRARLWSGGIGAVLVMGLPVLVLVTLFAPGILGFAFPRIHLFLFAASELLFFSVLILFNGILQGQERLDAMARVLAGLSFLRLAAVAAVHYGPGLTLQRFCLAYFSATVLLLAGALIHYGRSWILRSGKIPFAAILADARDGIYFAIIASGRGWLLGVDKMLLPAMATLTAAGQYAMGFRIVLFAYLPLQSFMAALYPRFFRQGEKSLAASMSLWRRAAPFALLYAAPMAILLFLLAPLTVMVLGDEYQSTPQVIRHLSGLLFIMALYVPLGDALAGANHFVYRAFSVLGALLANLGLNLWLIPDLGWRGSVIAAYVSHLLLLLLYVARVRRSGRVQALVPPAERVGDA